MDNKGFGFITDTTDPNIDYFFHFTGLVNGKVEKGDMVEFDLEKTNRGLKCVNVQKLTD